MYIYKGNSLVGRTLYSFINDILFFKKLVYKPRELESITRFKRSRTEL
jgi:hypothetical protein